MYVKPDYSNIGSRGVGVSKNTQNIRQHHYASPAEQLPPTQKQHQLKQNVKVKHYDKIGEILVQLSRNTIAVDLRPKSRNKQIHIVIITHKMPTLMNFVNKHWDAEGRRFWTTLLYVAEQILPTSVYYFLVRVSKMLMLVHLDRTITHSAISITNARISQYSTHNVYSRRPECLN